MLRHYTPEDLTEVAESGKLDLGLLHKMSYPLYKDALWKDVAAFWQLPLTALKQVPKALEQYFPELSMLHEWIRPRWSNGFIEERHRQVMKKMMDSGEPYSFDM